MKATKVSKILFRPLSQDIEYVLVGDESNFEFACERCNYSKGYYSYERYNPRNPSLHQRCFTYRTLQTRFTKVNETILVNVGRANGNGEKLPWTVSAEASHFSDTKYNVIG